jgi:hypothetical protein
VEAGTGSTVSLPPSGEPSTPSTPNDAQDASDDAATALDGDVDAGTQDAAPPVDSGPVGPCASPNTCPTATDLGTLSGDTGNGTKSAEGTGSQWLQVRMTEDDNSLFNAASLYMRAELTVPVGANYDIYVYRAPTNSDIECATPTTSSTKLGAFKTASMTWGEMGLIPNGVSDERTVNVEVRYVSGTCGPDDKWKLTLRGNSL